MKQHICCDPNQKIGQETRDFAADCRRAAIRQRRTRLYDFDDMVNDVFEGCNEDVAEDALRSLEACGVITVFEYHGMALYRMDSVMEV